MKIYAFSHMGKRRENYEDNYFLAKDVLVDSETRRFIENTGKVHVSEAEVNEESNCVFICDGMGGYGFGEVASLTCVEYINREYERIIKSLNEMPKSLYDMANDINECLLGVIASDEKYKRMATTICGLMFCGDSLFGLNMGDSRIYKYSKGKIKRVSVDNTEGERLYHLGIISKKEIKTYPNHEAIYKFLGRDGRVKPDIYTIGMPKDDDLLLLCTDGLSDALTDEEIEITLARTDISTREKGLALVEAAVSMQVDTGDDITLIIIDKH